MSSSFPAYVVNGEPHHATGQIKRLSEDELPPGDVVIDVEWSCLNYKDALAAKGHPGVAPQLPHVPGIDSAGVVSSSSDPRFAAGDRALVTGYDQGGARWGGYSGRVRVPADWPVPLPDSLTTRQAMTYGTAGFTAAQCVQAIAEKVAPDRGPVLVTGSTGGVGVFAVAILAKLGYTVLAVTGKPEAEPLLRQLGATEILPRDAVADDSGRPMLKARWAAAVDTVGGSVLETVLRSTDYRGVVSACGLVAGDRLDTTVYPFLLRGLTLAGIDSAKCPREPRLAIWELLAGDWRIDLPDGLISEVTLDELPEAFERILAGKMQGRQLVKPVAASV